jgi:pimeloyl-ACP methyl ester carboxylesterase
LESCDHNSVAKPVYETLNSITREFDLTMDGHRVHFLQSGSGFPVVLVHGLLAYSFSWRHTIPVLARHFSVIAPDLLGIGFSDRVPDLDCSMRATAQRLIAFFDALGLREFDLVGTSHGGAVATIIAAELGRRIRRLGLVAPVNPWSRAGRKRIAVLSTAVGGMLFRKSFLRLDALNNWVLERLFADPGKIPHGMFEAYAKPLRVAGSVDYLLGVARCWKRDIGMLEPMYAKIQVPTLLVWGDSDAAVLPDSARHVQRAIAGSRLVMLSNTGHLPYEESPGELNRVLLEFLRSD